MARLLCITGPTQGREYEFSDTCLLGRGSNCTIYIGDLTVSRQHARVFLGAQGRYLVEDLGSGNGSFVNGARVDAPQELQHNDLVRVGDVELRFAVEDVEPPLVEVATVVAQRPEELIHAVAEAARPLPPPRDDLDATELRTDLVKAHRMLETVYAVANATSSMLEPDQLFSAVLDYMFNVFPDADRGFVMLLDEQDQLVPNAVLRRGEGRTTGGLHLAQNVVARVLRDGKAVLSDDPLGRGKSASSTMCAPLASHGKTTGILHIEGQEDGAPFSKADLDLLTAVAMQTGVAYHYASMHQRLMRQQMLQRDLQFARQVQRSFMPPEPPVVPGFIFSRRYNPVYQVGGDFYDFIPLPDQRMGVIIGDVSGKGVSAALLMARLTSDMRYYAIAERSPSAVMQQANASLLRSAQDNMFATVLYVVLDLKRRCMTLCNAGHIPPLIHRAMGDRVQEVEQATNLALGVLPDPTFDEESVELMVGDSVLLSTDGVVEARSDQGEEYGFARLSEVLAAASPEQMLDAVLDDLRRHTGPTPQYDDITMVGFSRVD